MLVLRDAKDRRYLDRAGKSRPLGPCRPARFRLPIRVEAAELLDKASLHFLKWACPMELGTVSLAAGAWIVFLTFRCAPAYRDAKRRLRELERETPSLVAELRRVGDSHG